MSFILLVLISSTVTPRLPGPCMQTDGCQTTITITSGPVVFLAHSANDNIAV